MRVTVLVLQALLVIRLGVADPAHQRSPNPELELSGGARRESKRVALPTYTRNIKAMREICDAMALDGRLGDFQRAIAQPPEFSLDCPTCRPFLRIWSNSCRPKGSAGPSRGSQASNDSQAGDESGGDEAGAPTDDEASADGAEAPSDEEAQDEADGAIPAMPTPRPVGPERDPNIVVIDLTSRMFGALAEAEGAHLTLPAVDLLVRILRNQAEKTESARAYFDTWTEFMLAPFEPVREELARSLAEAPRTEDDNAAVDEMFEF